MKGLSYGIVLVVSLLLTGCLEDILDEHHRNKLVIWGNQPPDGKVGEPYSFRIGARVENTPFDDNYDFRFTLLDGQLPPGTEFSTTIENNVDYANVSGVPTEAGSYTFAVLVESNDLEREKEQEREAERDRWSFTNTEDRDEGLYTLVIVE